jgi:hypothetical protein
MRAGIFASALTGGGGGGNAFLGSTFNVDSLTTYSFLGLSIGAASATRRIAVAVARRSANGILSATIGGVSATEDGVTTAGGNGVSVISAVVPTGTTADIVVNFSGAPQRCGIGWWSLDDIDPTGQSASSVGTTPSPTVSTQSGDFVICGALTNSSGATYSWTNATERYDQNIESDINQSGADAVAIGTTLNVTASTSTGGSNTAVLLVGYR